MRENNKFHRSNRKWKARILAYLLVFAMTVMSVPVEMVSAETGGTQSTGNDVTNTDPNGSTEPDDSGDAGGEGGAEQGATLLDSMEDDLIDESDLYNIKSAIYVVYKASEEDQEDEEAYYEGYPSAISFDQRVYWCGKNQAMKIGLTGITVDQYLDKLEISVDGQSWSILTTDEYGNASAEVEFSVEQDTTIALHIRSMVNDYSTTIDVPVKVDLVEPSGAFTVNGAKFDSIYNKAYTDKLFVKIDDENDQLVLPYELAEETEGAPVKEIAFAVAASDVELDAIEYWEWMPHSESSENSGEFPINLSYITNKENVYCFEKSVYGANVIWMRLTDHAGNVSYVKSDSVIFYKDLEGGYTPDESNLNVTEGYVRYDKVKGGDLPLVFSSIEGAIANPDSGLGEIKVDDHIASVQIREINKDAEGNITGAGEYKTLNPRVDYNYVYDQGWSESASGAKGYVKLSHQLFAEASVTAEFDVKIMLKPYGKTFVEKYSDTCTGANEAPNPVYFRVKMEQGDSELYIVARDGKEDHSKVYDGKYYDNFSFVNTKGGQINQYHAKVAYMKDASGKDAPINDPEYYSEHNLWVGDYTSLADVGNYFMYVELVFEEGSPYRNQSAWTFYEITRRPVDATFVVCNEDGSVLNEKVYDGTSEIDIKEISVNTTIDDKELYLNPEAFLARFYDEYGDEQAAANVGDYKKVIVEATDIYDEFGVAIRRDAPVIREGYEDKITVSGPNNAVSDDYDNYSVRFIPIKASIVPREVTVSLNAPTEPVDPADQELADRFDAATKTISTVYGEDPKTVLSNYVSKFGYTLNNLAEVDNNEETIELIKNSLALSTAAEYDTGVGSYDITAQTTDATRKTNYTFVVDTKIKIDPIPLKVTWTRTYDSDNILRYNGEDYYAFATVTNTVLNNDVVPLTYKTYKGDELVSTSTDAARIKAIGEYITKLESGNPNYVATEASDYSWSVLPYEPDGCEPNVVIQGETTTNPNRLPYGNDDEVEDEAEKGVKGWFSSGNLTIQAPAGFIIAQAPADSNNSAGLSFRPFFNVYNLGEGLNTIQYYLQNADSQDPDYGCITGVRTLVVAVDKTKPEVEIEVKDNTNSFIFSAINKITGYFFGKTLVEYSIDYSDTDPVADDGIAHDVQTVSYAVVPQNVNYSDIPWEPYNKESGDNTLALMTQGDAPWVVWVRVLDRAGNLTEMNSAGIVVYEDAEITANSTTATKGLEFEKYSSKWNYAYIDFNNNTIKSIKIYSGDGTSGDSVKTLTEKIHYEVYSGYISFYPSAFDGLVTNEGPDDDYTPYTIKVEWNPVGKEFSGYGTAPAVLEIPLKYMKGKTEITVPDYQTVYNGKEIKNLVYSTDSVGEVSVKYYYADFGVNDAAKKNPIFNENLEMEFVGGQTAPKDAGYYYVKMTVAESADYQEATSAPALIYIEPKPVTAWITSKDKYYDGTKDAVVESIEIDTGINGETFTYESGLTAEFIRPDAGDNVPVGISGLNDPYSENYYGKINWVDGPGAAKPENYALQCLIKPAKILKRPLGIQIATITLEYSDSIYVKEDDFVIKEVAMPRQEGIPEIEIQNQGYRQLEGEEAHTLKDEVYFSYNPKNKVNVKVVADNTSVYGYKVVPQQITLEDMDVYSNNYKLYLVDGNGTWISDADEQDLQTVTLDLYQRDVQVEWQVKNDHVNNGEPVALDHNTIERINIGKERIIQNDSVIYNGYPYTVEIAGLNGVLDCDSGKVSTDEVEGGLNIYNQTTPRSGMQVEAKQLWDQTLDPLPDPLLQSNANWNYIIVPEEGVDPPRTTYNDAPYDKIFNWNVKYLDQYYAEDGYTDTLDACGNLGVRATGLDSVNSVSLFMAEDDYYERSLESFKNQHWVQPERIKDDNGVVIANKMVITPNTNGGQILLFDMSDYSQYQTKQELITALKEDLQNAATDPNADWMSSINCVLNTDPAEARAAADLILKEGNNLITYAVKDGNGYITTVRQGYVNVDNTKPTADITIKEDSKSILEKFADVIFGYFIKDNVTVNINAVDPIPQGVDKVSEIYDVAYVLVKSPEEFEEVFEKNKVPWITLTPKNGKYSVDLKVGNKYIIYTRIRDNAFNVAYINSEGVIIYDNGASTTTAPDGTVQYTFPRMEIEDRVFEDVPALKYPIAKVYYVPDGGVETLLTEGTHYQIDNQATGENGTTLDLTIKTDVWKNMPVGNYTFCIKYSPVDEEWNDEWTEGWDDGAHGDKPFVTEIPVTIVKSEGSVEINPDYAFTKVLDENNQEIKVITNVYNGKEVSYPDFTANHSQENGVKYQYCTYNPETEQKGEYSAKKPVDVGNYMVKVTVMGDENYKDAYGELAFKIAPAKVEIELPVQNKTYDGEKDATLAFSSTGDAEFKTGIQRNGVDEYIEIKDYSDIQCKFTTADAGKNKEVKVSDEDRIQIVGVDDTNANNYDVTFTAGNAEIYQKDATIKVGNISVEYGEDIPTIKDYVEEITGVLDADKENIGTYELKTNAEKGSKPAENYYDVSLDEEKSNLNANYKFTVQGDNVLTITNRVVAIKWVNKTADGENAETLQTAFDYDAKEHNVTPVIVESSIYGTDGVGLSYEGHKGTDAKSYVSKVTGLTGLAKDYYVLPSETEQNWSIQYNTDVKDAKVEFNSDKWYSGEVKIYAPTDYEIALDGAADAQWGTYITYSEQAEDVNGNEVTYYLKKGDAISPSKKVVVKLDNDEPGVEIKKNESVLNKILNALTFGYFFKSENVELTIVGNDSLSDVDTIACLESDTVIDMTKVTNLDSLPWVDLTEIDTNEGAKATYTMSKGKKVIYAKVTDHAGNVTVKNSDGVVVFVDSALKNAEITNYSYTKGTDASVTISTELYGNTVESVTVGRVPLDMEKEEYSVEYNSTLDTYGDITIENSYLKNLTAGEYKVVIKYKPQGVAFAGEAADAPKDTEVTLNVSMNDNATAQADPATLNKIYSGQPNAVSVTTSSAVAPIVKYAKENADGTVGTYTTNAPTDAGTYRIRVEVQPDNTYSAKTIDLTEKLTIAAYEVKVNVTKKEIVYGDAVGSIEFVVDNSTKLPNGKDESDLMLTLAANATNNSYGAINKGTYNVMIKEAKNANYDIDLQNEEGAFIVKARPITVDWGKTAFDYTAKEHSVAPTIKNLVGTETCGVTTTGDLAKSAVGNYSAQVTAVANNNYTVTGAVGLNCSWSISYNADDAAKSASYPQAPETGWYTENVVLTPPTGYVISTTGTNPDADWHDSISIAQQGENEHTYFLKNTATGAITEAKKVVLAIDKEAPKGEIVIKGNPFRTFFEDISFGLFCKNNVTVSISGTDEQSDIDTIEYLLSDTKLTKQEALNGTWKPYNSLYIDEGQKVIVYAKITDHAGHVTVINSDGVVIYTDVAQQNFQKTYTKTTKSDVEVTVQLDNGNTVKAVTALTEGDQQPAYSVQGGKITFAGTYLDELSAGKHNFAVSYNPYGADTGEDLELTLANIEIDVQRKNLTDECIEFVAEDSIVYGDEYEIEVINTGASTGEITVSYKGANDTSYIEAKPVNAGAYEMKVVVATDDNYNEIVAYYDFDIEPRPVQAIVWPEDVDYVYNESLYTMEATVTGVVNNDRLELVYSDGQTGTDVGEYTVSVLDLGNPNYTLEGATNEPFTWYIVYGDISEDINVSEAFKPVNAQPTDEGWYNSELTINAPEGTQIRIKGSGDDWDTSVKIDTEGNNSVIFEIKDQNGVISQTEVIPFPIDSTEPDVTVKIAGKDYTENATEDDPTVFAQEKLEIPLDVTDATEVTISYQVLPDTTWVDASTTGNKVVINAPATATVNVKVTDAAGNETTIQTPEIVVYTDAEQETTEIEFTKASEKPVTAKVALNGNEIASIKAINKETGAENDLRFTVDGDGNITFDAETLDQLSEGEYDVIISYNPCGKPYEDAEGNVAPANTTMDLSVEKADSILSVDELTADDFAKIYDGKKVKNPEFVQNDKGQTITYEYKKNETGASYSADWAPIEAGEYVVRITAEPNEYFNAYVKEIPFTIAKREVTVTAGTVRATANVPVSVSLDQVIVANIAEGHSVASINISGDTTRVTNNGTYTLSDLVIVDEAVTANYVITYKTDGILIVDHNTTLPPTDMTVEMDTEYTANDPLNKDDIIVTVFYSDGYEQRVFNYDSNIDDINMNQVDDYTVEISYTENGKTLTERIDITVAHNESSIPVGMEVTVPEREYVAGDALNLEGMEVKVTYADGWTEKVTGYVTNASDINMDQAGLKTLVVSYTANNVEVKGEISFTVAPNPASIPVDVTVALKDAEYVTGTPLTKEDVIVKVTFEDGHVEEVTNYESNIDEIDMSTIGAKTITVSYTKDEQTVTKDLTFTVAHNPASKPTKIEATLTDYEFVEGEELTLDGIVVKATYADGYVARVTDFETNIDEIDMNVPGVKTLVISYEEDGETVTQEILVVVAEIPEDGTDSGDGEFEIIQGEGAPETSITNDNVEELKETLLTTEEKEAIEAGEDYKIYLEVKDIEESVSDTDKQHVTDKMNEFGKNKLALGAYVDISLYTKVGNKEATRIKESDQDIWVSIIIPEELREDYDHIVRTYYMVRVHETDNGPQVDLIPGTFNGNDHTFKFKTKKFSTYAIVYSDVDVSGGGGNSGNGGNNAGGNDNAGTGNESVVPNVPKTGDDATPFVWSFALLLAISAFGVCARKLARKRR